MVHDGWFCSFVSDCSCRGGSVDWISCGGDPTTGGVVSVFEDGSAVSTGSRISSGMTDPCGSVTSTVRSAIELFPTKSVASYKIVYVPGMDVSISSPVVSNRI